MRKLSTAIKILISAAILFFLFRKASLRQAFSLAGAVDYSYILLAIAIIVIAQFVRAYRLAVMLFGNLERSEYMRVLRIQMVSFLPGLVTPAKIGEASKIYMLQAQSGASLSRATAGFVAEKGLDLLLLAPLAVIGLAALAGSPGTVSLRSGSVWVVALALICAAVGVPIGISIAKKKKISFGEILHAAAPKNLIEAAAVTVLYWGLVFIEVWCFCKSAHFSPSISHVAIAVPPALLSSLLPISFSGFGVREAALVFLLQRPQLHATYDQALLVSLMYIVFGLGVPALMGIYYWMPGKKDAVSQN